MVDDNRILYERKNIFNLEGHQLPAVISEATTLRDQFRGEQRGAPHAGDAPLDYRLTLPFSIPLAVWLKAVGAW